MTYAGICSPTEMIRTSKHGIIFLFWTALRLCGKTELNCQRYIPKPAGWVGRKVGFRVVCLPKIVQNLEYHRWIRRSCRGFCNHGSLRSQRQSMEGWQSEDMMIQKLQLTRQPLQETCTAAGGRWSQPCSPILTPSSWDPSATAGCSVCSLHPHSSLFLPGNN